jgi:hypothetical protein
MTGVYTVPEFGPSDLLTSAKEGTRRIKVEEDHTAFFEARERRSFKEWATATTATYVIRATTPINIILDSLEIALEAGSARIETVVGGTPGGTWAEVLPIFNANNMTTAPVYVGQLVLDAGGTHTGGTVLDVLRAKTDTNTNRSSSVGGAADSVRGVAPGVYYFRITLTGAIGVASFRWEERP